MLGSYSIPEVLEPLLKLDGNVSGKSSLITVNHLLITLVTTSLDDRANPAISCALRQ
jgi:hypothetical protein